MLSWNELLGESELEARLLHKGHDSRAAAEQHCAECQRVPLTGEELYRFEDGTICALCRQRRRDSPTSIEPVHHVEHGISVRRLAPPRAA